MEKVTKSSAGASDLIDLAPIGTPVWKRAAGNGFGGITLMVAVSSGASLTYKVEHTFDSGKGSPVRKWQDLDDNVDLTASRAIRMMAPVAAVRINITSHTSGNVTMRLVAK